MGDDQYEQQHEAWLDEFLRGQLQAMSHEPAFNYLAQFGDAIQSRVDACREEATSLLASGFLGQV